MTVVVVAPEVIDDFERILDHLIDHGVADALERIAATQRALQILADSPSIGRPVDGGKRELVIGRRSRGYVALYRYFEASGVVVVAAIKSRREQSYARDL